MNGNIAAKARLRYFDRDGEPMNMLAWSERFGDLDYKRVAEDFIGEAHVSTVWLGLNHRFGDGPPLIFETMIFGGEHEDYTERYSTEDEAREGHARAVALVKEEA